MFLGFVSAVYFLNLSDGVDKNLGYSIIAAVIATFSFVAGLSVWPVCLIQIALQDSSSKLKRVMLWSLFGVAIAGIYLYGYQKPPQTPSTLYFLYHPLFSAQIFFSSFGVPMIREANKSYLAGIFMMAIIICILFSEKAKGNRLIQRENIKWLSFILFSIFGCMEIVIGRSGMGLENAIAERYYLITSVYIIGLYCISLNNLKTPCCSEHDTNYIKNVRYERREFDKNMFKYHLNYILFGSLTVLLLIGFLSASLGGIASGPGVFQSKSEMAYYLKTYEIQPDKNLEKLYPNASRIRSIAPFLKKYNLTIFSERDTELNGLQGAIRG